MAFIDPGAVQFTLVRLATRPGWQPVHHHSTRMQRSMTRVQPAERERDLPATSPLYRGRDTTHVARRPARPVRLFRDSKEIGEMAPVADAAVVPSPAQAAADAEGLRKAVQGEWVTRIRRSLVVLI